MTMKRCFKHCKKTTWHFCMSFLNLFIYFSEKQKTSALLKLLASTVRNIELQFLAKVFRFHMKSAGFHEIRMKSGGFHEIHPKPCKIRRVFAETSDFMVNSAGFHGEICRIS